MTPTTRLIVAASCLLRLSEQAADERDYHELFGAGLSDASVADGARRHLSSSTEDLTILFEAEKRLAGLLAQESNRTAEEGNELQRKKIAAAKKFMDSLDYLDVLSTVTGEEYATHPVNAFHLLKRAATVLPAVKKHFPNLVNDAVGSPDARLPDRADFAAGATFGVLSLQVLHDLDPDDISAGLILDPASGATFAAMSNLTWSDCAMISARAKQIWRLDSHAEWARAAAAAHRRDSAAGSGSRRRQAKLDKAAAQAERAHDEFLLHRGFLGVRRGDDGDVSVVVTARQPYDLALATNNPQYSKHAAARDAAEYSTKMFENIAPSPPPPVPPPTEDDTPHKLSYFLEPAAKRLCRGENLRPAEMDASLSCLPLHRGDPYLRLGPLKYEALNAVPHVGAFRSFASTGETAWVRARARGRMKSTPLHVQDNNEEYTRHRTSKVMYINERNEDPGSAARKLSNRISAALDVDVYGDRFASENYQVMNYGIGGSIVGHLDSVGGGAGAVLSSESPALGGHRFVTFMVYLSDVRAGGRTVFPQAGLSVAPAEGDALFWFNLDSASRYDTRNFHLGCPVLVGNKWIANKWVKVGAQTWRYPCLRDKAPYPPFSNP